MAIPLALIPSLIGGVQALGGAFGSLFNKRPEYQIPAAVQQQLALQQMRAQSDIPNYAQAKSDIGVATANSISASREAGNPLLNVTNVQAQDNKAMNRLNEQNAAYKSQEQDKLSASLQNMGNYQDQQFQMNEYAPYADDKRMYENMFGAGLKNIMGGVDQMNAQDIYENSNRTSVNPNAPTPTAQLPLRTLTQPQVAPPFIPSMNQGGANMPYSPNQIGNLFNMLSGFKFR